MRPSASQAAAQCDASCVQRQAGIRPHALRSPQQGDEGRTRHAQIQRLAAYGHRQHCEREGRERHRQPVLRRRDHSAQGRDKRARRLRADNIPNNQIIYFIYDKERSPSII